eukprot:5045704-Prorocentrum_lima.AAC.1
MEASSKRLVVRRLDRRTVLHCICPSSVKTLPSGKGHCCDGRSTLFPIASGSPPGDLANKSPKEKALN